MNARERSDWSDATARAIRAERAARTWSQDELSARSEIPKSTLRRLENGERVADVTQVAKLAEAVSLDLAAFVSRIVDRVDEGGEG